MPASDGVDWEAVPLFVRMTNEFRRMPKGEAKDNFAKAVRASFKLDTTGNRPPKPCSATDISDEFGFTIVAQKKYGISLGKDAIFKELLEAINAPSNTYVYKRLTYDAYPSRFGRDPSLHNGKQMVLTVAEWLHFVPHEFPCPLPEAIREHLATLQ